MRTRWHILFIVGWMGLLSYPLRAEEAAEKKTLRGQIVEQIGRAHSSVDVVVYQIGSQEIADALIDAKSRGVRVRVVLDEERSFGLSKPERTLQDAGVAIRKVSIHQWKLLHDKFILFDGTSVGTPSYNQTDRADENDETDRVFSRQKSMVNQLSKQFQTVWNASRPAE